MGLILSHLSASGGNAVDGTSRPMVGVSGSMIFQPGQSNQSNYLSSNTINDRGQERGLCL